MQNSACWVILVATTAVGIGSDTQGDATAMSGYETLVAAWKREVALPMTMQYRYVTQVEDYKDGKAWLTLTYRVEYQTKGTKYRSSTSFERVSTVERLKVGGHEVPLQPGTAKDERAYNGQLFRVREPNDLVSQSQRADRIPPLTPLPWNILEIDTQVSLRDLLKDGTVRFGGMQEGTADSKSAVKAIFVYADTGTAFLEVWHDPHRGCYPIAGKEYSRNGTVDAELTGVELATIDVSGNKYILPVKGVWTRYKDGTVVSVRRFEVDRKSILLDQDIPDDVFALAVSAKDRIFDLDSNRLVWDPSDRDAYLEPIRSIAAVLRKMAKTARRACNLFARRML